MSRALEVLSILALGLLAGAMLLIGAGIVPYWQSLDPGAVPAWFARNAGFLGGVMVPLGGGTTLVTLLAAGAAWRARRASRQGFALAAALAVGVAAIYLLEHASLNAQLVSGELARPEVEAALERWRTWHWVRTGAGLLAFLAALVGLLRGAGGSGARVRLRTRS